MGKIKHLFSSVILLLTTGCASVSKYELSASESAPKNYPMKVVSGAFIFPEGGMMTVPSGKTIRKGWGLSVSSYGVGEKLKPLPDRLYILFFSYTENKFYEGDFDLPYDKILSLFKEGYYSRKQDKHATYDEMIVGIAPGGTVSVWLEGTDKRVEVFFGKAQEVEGDWTRINKNPNYTRERYVTLGLQDTIGADGIANLKKNGIPFDLWASYRPRYNWIPKVFANTDPTMLHEIKYYNGEKDTEFYPLNEKALAKARPVPSGFYILWEKDKKTTQLLKIIFDEEEIFEAFKKQYITDDEGNQADELEIHIWEKTKEDGRLIRGVQVVNNQGHVLLKKTKFTLSKR